MRSAEVGVFAAYGYRAPQPKQAVVIVQSPPCSNTVPTANSLLSTAGILWDELKDDSVLVQLEPPGVSMTVESSPDCRTTPQIISPQNWSLTVRAALAAFAGAEKLPVVYLGIDQGALPAALLAATDPRAVSLLIINGSGLNPDFENTLSLLRKPAGGQAQDLLLGAPTIATTTDAAAGQPSRRAEQSPAMRAKVPVLIIQSAANHDSQLASAALLLSQRTAAGRSASLVVVEGLGSDFGLNSGRTTCFENVMQLIAQQTRAIGQRAAAPLTRLYCSSPEQESPPQNRTEPQRLPPASSIQTDASESSD